jgi:uncharacterized RmlC-like cupin family protein
MQVRRTEYGVHVVRANDSEFWRKQFEETEQTTGLHRQTAFWPEAEGGATDALWFGRVSTPPGMDSGPHHHGRAETACYVMSGHFQLSFGENYGEVAEMGPGDFVYLKAFVPHIERNLSETEPVEFIVVRHPANIIVNL